MNILVPFEKAFQKMEERNWAHIYVMVDIHDTIFKACYHQREEFKWFPYAKETLDLMTHTKKIKLILWSSTTQESLDMYLRFFDAQGIHFDFVNINTEEKDTDLASFKDKTYFNVGIDDKFGFDALNDWNNIYHYLLAKIRLDGLK